MGAGMGEVRRWWRLLGSTAVLAVLAAAVLAGLTRPSLDTARTSTRSPETYAAPAPEPPPAYAPPEPGALLAPYDARRAVASRGDLGAAGFTVQGAALTTDDVPVAALAAYQRAATVIDQADPTCRLEWELLAAIGKVASDHGRAAGSALDENAVVRPKLLGPKLTGKRGTPRVADTDAGLVDGAERVDRAVGPMLLLPATWSVVRVDGDSDGRRNPQDLDDAALGVAVYLCAGPGDLRKEPRVREQVRRYHPGHEWLRAVLRARNDYRRAARQPAEPTVVARGSAVPLSEPTATLVPSPTSDPTYDGATTFAAAPPAPAPSATPKPTPSASPRPTPTASPSPTAGPSPSGSPSAEPSCEPTPTETATPTDQPTPTATPTPTVEPPPGACPTAPEPEPQPSGRPGEPVATTAASGAVLFAVPTAGWLWWRRRRSDEG